MTITIDPHKAPIADVQLSDCTKCHGDGFTPWPITDLDRWMDAAHEAGWSWTSFEPGRETISGYTVSLTDDVWKRSTEGCGKTRGEALVRAVATGLKWDDSNEDAPSETA